MKMLKFPLAIAALLLAGSLVAQTNTDAIGYNQVGLELMRTKPEEAIKMFDKAIAADASYWVSYSNKSSIQCAKGDFTGAIVTVQTALKNNPNVPEGALLLGMLYDRSGDAAKAKTQYQNAVSLYTEQMKASSEPNETYSTNKLLATFLIGEDDHLSAQLSELSNQFPYNSTLKQLAGFDKAKYLNAIFAR